MRTSYSTVGERLDVYQRWELQCDYVAGALGVLLVIIGLAANASKDVPGVVWPLLLTLVVLAGAFVGRARLGLSSAESVLKFDVESHNRARTEPVPTDDKFKLPSVELGAMWVSLALLAIAGILLLIAAWWAVIGQQPKQCTLKWDEPKHEIICVEAG